MDPKIWVLWVSVLCISIPASAQFYKYKGADGAIHYTDDLSQVPRNQRPRLNVYLESEGESGAEKGEVQKAQESPSIETGTQKSQGTEEKTTQETPEPGAELDEMQIRLDARKMELEQERDALRIEEEYLKRIQSRFNEKRNKEARKFYNKKVLKYEKKLTTYQNKLRAFNRDLKIYNDKVKIYNAQAEK